MFGPTYPVQIQEYLTKYLLIQCVLESYFCDLDLIFKVTAIHYNLLYITADIHSRSWPTLHLNELSNKEVRELVRAELSSYGHSLSSEQENRLLTHCRSPATCVPLYVVVVANDLAR